MPDTSSLTSRLDAEFKAVEEKGKKVQAAKIAAAKERQDRLDKLTKVFEEMREVWRPRLELLAKKFGDRVKVTPSLQPSSRQAFFEFKSSLARVRLKFSALTDRDVTKAILAYDVSIIPVLMRFEPHAEIEFPLDSVNKDAVAAWLEERILAFVRTYLSLGDNDYYLKEHMVEDPVAKVRFPKQAAAASLEYGGTIYYFVGEETRREFVEKNKISSK